MHSFLASPLQLRVQFERPNSLLVSRTASARTHGTVPALSAVFRWLAAAAVLSHMKEDAVCTENTKLLCVLYHGCFDLSGDVLQLLLKTMLFLQMPLNLCVFTDESPWELSSPIQPQRPQEINHPLNYFLSPSQRFRTVQVLPTAPADSSFIFYQCSPRNIPRVFEVRCHASIICFVACYCHRH